jgi:hypothetical protein
MCVGQSARRFLDLEAADSDGGEESDKMDMEDEGSRTSR